MNKRLEKEISKYADNVEFWEQGNFTICVLFNKKLRDKNKKIKSIGVSKKNQEDQWDTDTGGNIALSRAIRGLW